MATWANDEGYSEGDMRVESSRPGIGAQEVDVAPGILPDWVQSMSEAQRSGSSPHFSNYF